MFSLNRYSIFYDSRCQCLVLLLFYIIGMNIINSSRIFVLREVQGNISFITQKGFLFSSCVHGKSLLSEIHLPFRSPLIYQEKQQYRTEMSAFHIYSWWLHISKYNSRNCSVLNIITYLTMSQNQNNLYFQFYLLILWILISLLSKRFSSIETS